MWNLVYQIHIVKIENTRNKFIRLQNFSSFHTPEERNRIIGIKLHEIRWLRGDLINNTNFFFIILQSIPGQKNIKHFKPTV